MSGKKESACSGHQLLQCSRKCKKGEVLKVSLVLKLNDSGGKRGPCALGNEVLREPEVVCDVYNAAVLDVVLRVLKTYRLNPSARASRIDFETEGSARVCAIARGVVKTKMSQTLVDSFLGLTLSFSEWQCCEN